MQTATAVVFLVGETTKQDVVLWKSTLSKLKRSSYFYLAYADPGNIIITTLLNVFKTHYYRKDIERCVAIKIFVLLPLKIQRS